MLTPSEKQLLCNLLIELFLAKPLPLAEVPIQQADKQVPVEPEVEAQPMPDAQGESEKSDAKVFTKARARAKKPRSNISD